MSNEQTVVLQGNEALSKFIDFWMDGFCSGQATVFVTLGLSDAAADTQADAAVAALRADPLAMAVVEQQVREALIDHDSGPKNFTIKGGPR